MTHGILRKCTAQVYDKATKEYYQPEEFYFHSWSNEKATNMHPEDPQKDHVYSYTIAILEHIRTGRVVEACPTDITFLK